MTDLQDLSLDMNNGSQPEREALLSYIYFLHTQA